MATSFGIRRALRCIFFSSLGLSVSTALNVAAIEILDCMLDTHSNVENRVRPKLKLPYLQCSINIPQKFVLVQDDLQDWSYVMSCHDLREKTR